MLFNLWLKQPPCASDILNMPFFFMSTQCEEFKINMLPPCFFSVSVSYGCIHIVFVYVTTFGNESKHNSHITTLVFHNTSKEAERIYAAIPFISHSNTQSWEKPSSCQSITCVLRDPHLISGVKVSAFYPIDCILIFNAAFQRLQSKDLNASNRLLTKCMSHIFLACISTDPGMMNVKY